MAQFGIGDEVLGGWRIVREIGSGGFGTVFEVDKPGRGFVARAALKVIPVPPGPEAALSLRAEGMDDASIAAYFRDVAEACAGLRSDGTVHICGDANSYASALNWTDLVAVSLGDFTMMGLKKDGSVLILGSYERSDGSWTSADLGEA